MWHFVEFLAGGVEERVTGVSVTIHIRGLSSWTKGPSRLGGGASLPLGNGGKKSLALLGSLQGSTQIGAEIHSSLGEGLDSEGDRYRIAAKSSPVHAEE